MKNQSKKDEVTCIQLSKETRDKLAERGKKGDTFDEIIKGLISEEDASTGNSRNEEEE